VFCRVDVRLYNDDGDHYGFGKGMVSLLEGVEKYGSINKATLKMGMAYSKAWRLIKSTEEELGVELISRDGARGSAITQEAKKLIRCYKEMNAAAKAVADKRMIELLGVKKEIKP